MGHRVRLERFDNDDAGSAEPGPGQTAAGPAGAEPPATTAPPAPSETPGVTPEPSAAEPPPPAADRLAPVIDALAALAADRGAARAEAHRSAAEAFGRAAAAAAPRLAATAFPAEVARAALQIAGRLAPETPVLGIAAEDASAVEAAFAALSGPSPRLAVVEGLAPGRATLSWTDGGAEIDREALADAALACLAEALPARPTDRTEDTR